MIFDIGPGEYFLGDVGEVAPHMLSLLVTGSPLGQYPWLWIVKVKESKEVVVGTDLFPYRFPSGFAVLASSAKPPPKSADRVRRFVVDKTVSYGVLNGTLFFGDIEIYTNGKPVQ